MEVQSSIGKWGNSPAIRVPVAVIKAAEFSLRQPVRVVAEPGRLVIEPCSSVEYDLKKLVSEITPQNSHRETDFGLPVGKEVW